MTLDIYTDARSGERKFMQIACIAVDEDDNEFHFVERTSIGLVKNNWKEFHQTKLRANSSIAEIYSIYNILSKIESSVSKNNFKFKNLNIFTDSLNSFNFINDVSRYPDQITGFKPHMPKSLIIKKINTQIKSIIERLASAGIEVKVMWIKGHGPCYFNVKADRLCKSDIKPVNTLNF